VSAADLTPAQRWLRWAERRQIHVVGTFLNEHGERFVIYRNPTGDTPYITGDELDWEPKVHLLWLGGQFIMSAAEREQVARIMWPVLDDFAGATGMPERPTLDTLRRDIEGGAS
jgi:hypothetical protein